MMFPNFKYHRAKLSTNFSKLKKHVGLHPPCLPTNLFGNKHKTKRCTNHLDYLGSRFGEQRHTSLDSGKRSAKATFAYVPLLLNFLILLDVNIFIRTEIPLFDLTVRLDPCK